MKPKIILSASSLFLGATLLGAALPAQIAVSPKEFTKTEAPSSDTRPFGSASSTGYRFLQVHDDLKGKKFTVRELAWRRDGTRTGRSSAYQFTCSIVMSTAKTNSQSIDGTFDKNHGSNKKTVLTNRTIKWPASRSQGVARAWDFRIKLDTPYVFDGAGSFCWESRSLLYRGLTGSLTLDYAWSSNTSPALASGSFGTGCYHSTQTTPANLTVSSSANYRTQTGSLRFFGRGLARNTLAIGAIGFSKTSLAGIPLPFTIPGSGRQYSGPCTFYTSLDIFFGAATTSSGTSSNTVPIPVDVKFAGIKLFSQLLSPDAATGTSIALITSNAAEFQFVAPYKKAPVSRVIASNTASLKGVATKTFGLVTAIF